MTESTGKKPDDLEAVRKVVEALQEFKADDQERILRWSREKVGLTVSQSSSSLGLSNTSAVAGRNVSAAQSSSRKDVRSFVDLKNPTADTHLAATIAYYYKFEAPESERRDSIDTEFLREALRLAGRPGALVHPGTALRNAVTTGLMDRVGSGSYTVNSVGENLVGMTLPGEGVRPRRSKQGKPKKGKRKGSNQRTKALKRKR